MLKAKITEVSADRIEVRISMMFDGVCALMIEGSFCWHGGGMKYRSA